MKPTLSSPSPVRSALRRAGLCLALGLQAAAWAQSGSGTVYRCPGPPVLYTDALSPAEAKQKGCRVIESAPVTVVQSRRGTGAPAGGGETATPRPSSPDARVDSSAQRARDQDARRILEAELRKEEEGLAELQREFNNGEPERRGDERNFQKYSERVNEMRAAIARKQADIEALRRELSKLPAS